MPISDRDLQRECQAQLVKLRTTMPEFQYNPEKRLAGAKAVFDAQQLADAQIGKEAHGNHPQTLLPQIQVQPPPSPPGKQRVLEKASEVQGQKKLQVRKKPDTRGKTFHFTEKPIGQTKEERSGPGSGKTKSSFYLET